MSEFHRFGALRTGVVLALLAASVVGCSSSKKAGIYEHESFDDSGTFSRNYPVSDMASCEAARRALLSQGYIITSSDPKLVAGHKSFQQTADTHLEISFNVTCAADTTTNKSSIVFANALLDRYALKKSNTSASLGVGVLGSVSMPIGSSDDSMVKVASETVASDTFYDRYFALVENFLPPETKKAAHIEEKPSKELGVPEEQAAKPAKAAAAAPAPHEAAAQPAPQPATAAPAAPASLSAPASPAATAPQAQPAADGSSAQPSPEPSSEPVAPPADAAPIEVQGQ
ncbi:MULTISPECIES: DUF2242 domain-containing protein [unclassified Pseudomonas]|uniref:DUF2242 domain-containing protein n=1 Tax=unclassified Pseudomonas TaxID=196821 RepID=UPI000BCE1ADB|nr:MULTISPECIES: DUF2242 domain-containing protein [unclassified Pseudomonas]PVZ13873.1 uncharacterized protein DUF2242 [Pseudomonas sp. URIL14HWK12:I12]PVZ24179.1 uncharacterized protein DUF2242 [Pseudomonas sp. URIL14HWK12:I10]PVZ33182.1 uncharacterized protein DUF2242 [Pseudomonas sp. URIL14HWK12:I11]SNZ10632.1 hypothetical protein SAMN05660463_01632 [Pseudomonas sp. URIL14HWK12:I9]